MGRPLKYTDTDRQEVMDIICDIISTSNKSVKTILLDENLPSISEFQRWMNEKSELGNAFRSQYAHAKELQADFLAEEIIEISDDSSQDLERIDDYGNRIENKEFVNRSRLRVDARKWVAAKLRPKKYGDKIEFDGEVKQTINPDILAAIAQKINSSANPS